MAYLTVARSVSVQVAYTHLPKKLLILDLNGTLLLRSKPRNARRRPIHLRPYMNSFCSYIFHETVKPWLEAMIWSSAQPHNVHEMVTRCFGDRRDELKAIWARDTLGLEKHQYFRKVQTVKDLEKCWSGLSDSTRPPHNAETSLLIDDSARKAHLQPYNHLCVPEYTQNLRNRDLIIKAKIAQTQEERIIQVTEQAHLGFDTTLIAVIGILDEIKEQTNVSGWIRAGGLWAGHDIPASYDSSFELFSDDGQDGSGRRSALDDRSRQPKSKPDETECSSPLNPGNDIVFITENPWWFDHPPCYQQWVDRGISVAKVLGIELHHGITQ